MLDNPNCDTLEERYATNHVGGAFNAKNIQKPKSIDQALKDATIGGDSAQSLMTEGMTLDRYINHDDILPENKRHPFFPAAKPEPAGVGRPSKPQSRPFVPTPQRPFPPIPDNPRPPIYWNTDSDIWDFDKLIGQIYWDLPANQSNGDYYNPPISIPSPIGSDLAFLCPCGTTSS